MIDIPLSLRVPPQGRYNHGIYTCYECDFPNSLLTKIKFPSKALFKRGDHILREFRRVQIQRKNIQIHLF
jgi:hypothetical protein